MQSSPLEPAPDLVGENAVRRGLEVSLPVDSAHGQGSPDDNPGLARSDDSNQREIGGAAHSFTEQNPDDVIR